MYGYSASDRGYHRQMWRKAVFGSVMNVDAASQRRLISSMMFHRMVVLLCTSYVDFNHTACELTLMSCSENSLLLVGGIQ